MNLVEKIVSETFAEVNYDDIFNDQLSEVGNIMNLGRDRSAINNCDIAQYSAILDRKTCELCKYLDGMVFKVGSDLYKKFMPRIHHKCRCVYAYIGRDEVDPPMVNEKEPPSDLVHKHGTFTKNTSIQKTVAVADRLPTQLETTSKDLRLRDLQKMSAVIKTLPAINQKAISEYQNKSISKELNGSLRIGKIPTRAKLIDRAFEIVTPLSQSINVFRGATLAMFGANKPIPLEGDVFIEQAFSSTSIDRKIAEEFSEDLLLEIIVPSGKKVLPIGNNLNEAEILLPRGSKFKVISVEKSSDPRYHWIIKCELI